MVKACLEIPRCLGITCECFISRVKGCILTLLSVWGLRYARQRDVNALLTDLTATSTRGYRTSSRVREQRVCSMKTCSPSLIILLYKPHCRRRETKCGCPSPRSFHGIPHPGRSKHACRPFIHQNICHSFGRRRLIREAKSVSPMRFDDSLLTTDHNPPCRVHSQTARG